MSLESFIFALSLFGVSQPLAVDTWQGANAHNLAPHELAGYLVSEHRGSYPLDKCSDAGACGVFQLMPMWPGKFGFTREDREDPSAAAEIAAGVLVYSMESHEDCGRSHDWRAHLKTGPGNRDSEAAVRGVRRMASASLVILLFAWLHHATHDGSQTS